MDKLRALQYFVAAAQTGSFSGAARGLDVSVPAVARLVTALESKIGIALFDRSAQGLALTADGHRYLAGSLPVLAQVASLDETIGTPASRSAGTIVVGAPPYLAQHCILPGLPAFHANHPQIQVDLRNVDRIVPGAVDGPEVLVLYGWPEHGDRVHRRIAQTRSLICASPAYWARMGVPARPRDLERHTGLLFRDQEGTVLDLWEYARDSEKEAVTVSGWLIASHRDVLLDAALAGLGVARFTDLSIRPWLESGALVPVLLDWTTRHSPPVNLLYRASQRRTPRVRAFIDFVTALFQDLEAAREPRVGEIAAAERPHWYRRRRPRASTSVAGERYVRSKAG